MCVAMERPNTDMLSNQTVVSCPSLQAAAAVAVFFAAFDSSVWRRGVVLTVC